MQITTAPGPVDRTSPFPTFFPSFAIFGRDGEEDTQAVGAEAGASVQATLAAGRLVAGSGEGGGGGSAEGGASGEVGGLGGVRHRAAVAEARRHLGGGGKRGWAE